MNELQNHERMKYFEMPNRDKPSSLHNCRSAEEFPAHFEATTGKPVQNVIDQIVESTAPKAVFLTGSLPLGMATKGSDVDFIVLVDSKAALLSHGEGRIANTEQRMVFSNESDPLRAGLSISVMRGMTVEVSTVVTSSIASIYRRLRSRGPELSEIEIMTLGRLSTGWLLSQTDGYLERSGVALTDPALAVYCSTRSYTFSLIYRHKALAAIGLEDIPQALHLGRLSVEMAYLAYFASEGMTYLGPKWLAQIGHAVGASERLRRHPILMDGVQLLFPNLVPGPKEVGRYLETVSGFITSLRMVIERKTLFRIAFKACPQIYSVV